MRKKLDVRSLPVFVAGFLMLAGLSGCSLVPPKNPTVKESLFHPAEVMLGTDSEDAQRYHSLVYYPFEHALRFPGMIVGIEKSNAMVVTSGMKEEIFSLKDQGGAVKEYLLHQPKTMFISHVIRTKAGGGVSPYADPVPEFLYNAYESENLSDNAYRYGIDGVKLKKRNNAGVAVRTDDYFSESWTAIDRFKGILKDELKGRNYTHVVVVVMGWNTQQIEAVQNFNSIVSRLHAVAEEKNPGAFRPYVIGVTWPSEWIGGTAEHAISLFNKANDADEVGGGWLAQLFERGIYPVTTALNQNGGEARQRGNRPKLIVIGHSFGARATSQAVCNGSFFTQPGHGSTAPVEKAVDWLIGLQGAYSLNRFTPDGAGFLKMEYKGGQCIAANDLIFTASPNDEVATLGGTVISTGNFAGTAKSYEHVRDVGLDSNEKTPNNCLRFATYKATSAAGEVTLDPGKATDLRSRFIYVNAEPVVYYHAFSTSKSSGAHSDVYRMDTARMLWNLMDLRNAAGQNSTCTNQSEKVK